MSETKSETKNASIPKDDKIPAKPEMQQEWDDEDDNTNPSPCSHGHCGHKHD